MDLLPYKITAATLIFLTTLLAVIYPIKSRAYPCHHRPLELADALASGIFLGTALFHMLPDATKGFANIATLSNYPIAEFLCAAGFLILLFLDRVSHYVANANNRVNLVSYMLAFILIVHAFIEGTVLGINVTFATASVIFIAIIAHKGSESFALAVILNRSGFSLMKVINLIVLFAVMTPLGIGVGALLTDSLHSTENILFTAGFNAFAAGTFLYMSTLHHINHHQRQHETEGLFEFGALLTGLVIMGVLAWWA